MVIYFVVVFAIENCFIILPLMTLECSLSFILQEINVMLSKARVYNANECDNRVKIQHKLRYNIYTNQ